LTNKTLDCPFCNCFFFTEHDLALHLNAFADKEEAHKEAVQRLHAFVEEFGTFQLNDTFTGIEFVTPEQLIFQLERDLKKFFCIDANIRKSFKKKGGK
jgi:isopenicillin N synthase-like dioxygenase